MIDLNALMSLSTFIYLVVIVQTIIISIASLKIYYRLRSKYTQKAIGKGRQNSNVNNVSKSKINPVSFLILFILAVTLILWYGLTIFNFSVNLGYFSLLGTRLAFAVVPWTALEILILFWAIGNHFMLTNKLQAGIAFVLTIAISVLAIVDTDVIKLSIPHSITGTRDIPIFGTHIIVFGVMIVLLLVVVMFSVVTFYFSNKNKLLKNRYKIIFISFIFASIFVMLLNVVLPALGHPEFIDYGILSSLFVIYGIYLALEDRWVYSVRYLLAKNLALWLLGSFLFVVVRIFEFIMFYVFNLSIVNIHDYSAQLFGLLLGIGVAYILDYLYKIVHTWGLGLLYSRYYKFKRHFDKYVYKATYHKTPQKAIIKSILELILRTLSLERVCIFEAKGSYIEDYEFCVPKNEAISEPLKHSHVLHNDGISLAHNAGKRVDKNKNNKYNSSRIEIKLMRNRFLYLYTKDGFVPKEFVDLLKTRRSALNALVNWDITDRNLRYINSKLARAVVIRTKQLDKVIDEQKKTIHTLTSQLNEYKQFIPDVVTSISKNIGVLQDYLTGILKQAQNNPELQFMINHLYENVQDLTNTIHELTIFSEVMINKRITRTKADFRMFLEDILAVWRFRYENKMVGLVPDVFPEHIKVTADFKKLSFAINFILKTMLQEILHGYVQVIARIEGSYIRVKINMHPTGDRAALHNPKDQQAIIDLQKNLYLIEKIIHLHKGLYSQTLERGFLIYVEFTLPISGI